MKKMIKYVRALTKVLKGHVHMASISRRKMLKSTIAGTALASSSSISWAQEKARGSGRRPHPKEGQHPPVCLPVVLSEDERGRIVRLWGADRIEGSRPSANGGF